MDNSESVTGSSLENPQGLHEGGGELHQAEKIQAGGTEGASLKNRTRTAKKDDGKEVGHCEIWSLHCNFIKAKKNIRKRK